MSGYIEYNHVLVIEFAARFRNPELIPKNEGNYIGPGAWLSAAQTEAVTLRLLQGKYDVTYARGQNSAHFM
jgi:hypothetical protein